LSVSVFHFLPVKRQIGIAVLDRRQVSPATQAFIDLACRFDYR